MPTTVSPALMFQDGNAEAAINFYVSLFETGKVIAVARHGAGVPGMEGKVARASFTLTGQTIFAFDSPIKHAFEFTPSVSLFIECQSEEEIKRLAAALGDGGEVLMELSNYGFSRMFTWLNDRYGVSWQINLA